MTERTGRALVQAFKMIEQTPFEDSDLAHPQRPCEAPQPAGDGAGHLCQASKLAGGTLFSTMPGDILDEIVSTPRGRAFATLGSKTFLGSMKLIAATTDKLPGRNKAASAARRVSGRLVDAIGGESARLKGLGGASGTHLLGATFFSHVPMLFGPYGAKLCIAPVAPVAPEMILDRPDRRAMELEWQAKPAARCGARVLRVHVGEEGIAGVVCNDLATVPIEDASVVWPVQARPCVAVARITVAPQTAWSPAARRRATTAYRSPPGTAWPNTDRSAR